MNPSIFQSGYSFKQELKKANVDIYDIARKLRDSKDTDSFINQIINIQIDNQFTSESLNIIKNNASSTSIEEMKLSFLTGFLSEETYLPVKTVAEIYALDRSSVSKANSQGRFAAGEYYTSGGVSYVLPSAVEREFNDYIKRGKKNKRRS